MPASPTVKPGGMFGAYELGERLASGGMGAVFRARHVGLQRDCALKLLRSGCSG